MKKYIIAKYNEDQDWSKIPMITVDINLWHEDLGYKMYGQVAWDEGGLYVHQWCREDNIRAEITENNKMVSEDSVMEFFVMPAGEDRYLNVEVNPNGRFYFGFCRKRDDWIRMCDPYGNDILKAETAYIPDGWEVRYKIPAEIFRLMYGAGFKFESGLQLRANMFKGAELSRTPHNLVWNPIDESRHDYHLSADFGEMVLE